MRELLEAATDSHISNHLAVMTAIEGIGARLSVLDDAIASSDTFASSDASHPIENPTHTPPPVATCHAGSARLPIPSTWGHNFQPAPPPPAPLPAPSPSMVYGLRVDTAHAGAPGGKIKTPCSLYPAWRARTMKTNRFDLAGLTNSGYHIGDDGVAAAINHFMWITQRTSFSAFRKLSTYTVWWSRPGPTLTLIFLVRSWSTSLRRPSPSLAGLGCLGYG